MLMKANAKSNGYGQNGHLYGDGEDNADEEDSADKRRLKLAKMILDGVKKSHNKSKINEDEFFMASENSPARKNEDTEDFIGIEREKEAVTKTLRD